MLINIFGTGRSGTTALLLYLSYQCAKKDGKLWINNEPMRWQSRVGPISYEGQRLVYEHALYANPEDKVSAPFDLYLRNLMEHPGTIVNKFVAGSGFAHQINSSMNPDATIVIVRRLEDVLRSLSGSNWDYFSIIFRSLPNIDAWKVFKNSSSVKAILKKQRISVSDINTRERANALYWYLSNRNLLMLNAGKVHFISFEKLSTQAKIIAASILGGDEAELEEINQTMFYDSNLASNYPLTNTYKKRRELVLNVLSEISCYASIKTSLRLPQPTFQIGSHAKLSVDSQAAIGSKTTNPNTKRYSISQDGLLQKFQCDIDEMMARREIL